MSFKIRLENVRLLPSDQKSIRGATVWKNPKSGRTIIPLDEFDDDAEITTPNSVRENSRPFISQGFLSKSGSSVYPRAQDITDGPTTPIKTRDSGLSHFGYTQVGEKNTEAIPNSSLREGTKYVQNPVDSSPSQKLISDENQLATDALVSTLSPPRKGRTILDPVLAPPSDMEFDPSDQELPEKRNSVVNIGVKSGKTVENGESNKDSESTTGLKNHENPLNPEFLESVQRHSPQTPSRLSPLRNEVLPSSSMKSNVSDMKSTASNMLEEIRNSGALKPRTVEEIHDQIHSSMLRLEQSSLRSGSESDDSSYSSEIEEDSEEEGLLNKLDKYIPPTLPQDSVEGSPPAVKQTENVFQSPEKPNTPTGVSNLSRIDLELLKNTISPTSRTKKNRTRRTGKLSGKYARKKIKDNKERIANKRYPDWLADQWHKLKKLVELSVPNHVIASSFLVMKELKCGSKGELAQRVRFLERFKKTI